MRIDEIVTEDPVQSTWISDLTLQQNQQDITVALGNGRRYKVRGAGKDIYRAWVQAASKGKFWHEQIRNRFVISRLI
jgi:hypothetical protein